MKIFRFILSTLLYFFTNLSFFIFTILISINFVFDSKEKAKSFFRETEVVSYIKDPIQNQIVESLLREYGEELSPTYRIQLSQQIIDQNFEKDIDIAIDQIYDWNREDNLEINVSLPDNSMWPLDEKPNELSIIKIEKGSIEQKTIKTTLSAINSTKITSIIVFVILFILMILFIPRNKITTIIIYGLLAFLGITLASIALQGMINVSNNIAEEYITSISSVVEKYLNTSHIPYDPIENSTKALATVISWIAQRSLSLQVTMTYISVVWIMIFLIIRVLTIFRKKRNKSKSLRKEISNTESKNIDDSSIENKQTINPKVIVVTKKDETDNSSETVTDSTERDIIKSGKIKIRKTKD